MRSARLGKQFDAIVLGFNTLMHLTKDADLAACLETVAAHLSQRGRFFFDLYTPYPSLNDRAPEGRYDPQQLIDPRSGERWVISENNSYDPRSQINSMHFYYRRVDKDGREVGPEKKLTLKMRVSRI